MASMTDLVTEGLKYPFNDVKRLLTFGVLFAIINIISFGISEEMLAIVRIFNKTPGNSFLMKFPQLAGNNLYVILLLAIVSFIITLLIMGYQYNVTKFSIEQKEDLPGFQSVRNLPVNGVKYLIVTLAYNIIPMIVFVVGIYTVGLYYNGDYLIVILSTILFVICNFLLIMALSNMISTDKLSDAFKMREIIDKISNLGWIRYIGIILFTLIVYGIILIALELVVTLITGVLAIAIGNAMIISAITAIIEGLIISSYGCVFFARVSGSVYNEAVKGR